MAEISLIVPVYKVQKFLPRCVSSVLRQSFSDFELILVDDGSPDGCPAMCDDYAAQEDRIHVIHQENGGLSAARNAGLDWVMENSESAWIMFLDSDDWLHRDCLKRLHDAARQGNAQLAVCSFLRVSDQQEDKSLGDIHPQILSPEQAYREYYSGCMTACCKLIARNIMEEIRFPLGKLHEDAFVTHRMVFSAEKLAVLPEELYYYYFNPNSITRKTWQPRRLDELEGHRVRLQYLKEHGYPRAEEAERMVLAITIYEHLETLLNLKEPQYAKIQADLRRQLRQALKAARDRLPFGRKHFFMYLAAWHLDLLWRLGKKAQSLRSRRQLAE